MERTAKGTKGAKEEGNDFIDYYKFLSGFLVGVISKGSIYIRMPRGNIFLVALSPFNTLTNVIAGAIIRMYE